MESYWTVCRTHVNCEKIAMRNLQNQGFEHYCPMFYERRVVSKRGFVLRMSALFPSYVFVRINDKWSPLKSTYGISKVLTIDGVLPAKVRDEVVEQLRAREDKMGCITLPKPKTLARGDLVTIEKGTLTGQQALVERMPSKDRQKVLLALLSNKIKVLIEETDVRTHSPH